MCAIFDIRPVVDRNSREHRCWPSSRRQTRSLTSPTPSYLSLAGNSEPTRTNLQNMYYVSTRVGFGCCRPRGGCRRRVVCAYIRGSGRQAGDVGRRGVCRLPGSLSLLSLSYLPRVDWKSRKDEGRGDTCKEARGVESGRETAEFQSGDREEHERTTNAGLHEKKNLKKTICKVPQRQFGPMMNVPASTYRLAVPPFRLHNCLPNLGRRSLDVDPTPTSSCASLQSFCLCCEKRSVFRLRRGTSRRTVSPGYLPLVAQRATTTLANLKCSTPSTSVGTASVPRSRPICGQVRTHHLPLPVRPLDGEGQEPNMVPTRSDRDGEGCASDITRPRSGRRACSLSCATQTQD
jgi:hypothetical protein